MKKAFGKVKSPKVIANVGHFFSIKYKFWKMIIAVMYITLRMFRHSENTLFFPVHLHTVKNIYII